MSLTEIDPLLYQAWTRSTERLFATYQGWTPMRAGDVLLAVALAAHGPAMKVRETRPGRALRSRRIPFFGHVISPSGRHLQYLYSASTAVLYLEEWGMWPWLEAVERHRPESNLRIVMPHHGPWWRAGRGRRSWRSSIAQWIVRVFWDNELAKYGSAWNCLVTWRSSALIEAGSLGPNFMAGHFSYNCDLFGRTAAWELERRRIRIPRGLNRRALEESAAVMSGLTEELIRLGVQLRNVRVPLSALRQALAIVDCTRIFSPWVDDTDPDAPAWELAAILQVARSLALLRGSLEVDPVLDMDPLARCALSRLPTSAARVVAALSWYVDGRTMTTLEACRVARVGGIDARGFVPSLFGFVEAAPWRYGKAVRHLEDDLRLEIWLPELAQQRLLAADPRDVMLAECRDIYHTPFGGFTPQRGGPIGGYRFRPAHLRRPSLAQ